MAVIGSIVVGIDVRPDRVRVARVSMSLGGIEVLDFAEEFLAADEGEALVGAGEVSPDEGTPAAQAASHDGEAAQVEDPADRENRLLTLALKRLRERGALQGDKVVAGFTADRVSMHTVVLPFSDDKRIEQTLPFELESVLPFELANGIWDYRFVKREANHATLLVAYVEKKTFVARLAAMREAGVEPRMMTITTMAYPGLWFEALRDVNGRAPSSDRVFGVIDIEPNGATVCVAQGHLPRTARSFASGYETLARDLASEPAPALLKQLRLTLQADRSSYGNGPDALYLVGEGARVEGLADYLAVSLGVPVHVLQMRLRAATTAVAGAADKFADLRKLPRLGKLALPRKKVPAGEVSVNPAVSDPVVSDAGVTTMLGDEMAINAPAIDDVSLPEAVGAAANGAASGDAVEEGVRVGIERRGFERALSLALLAGSGGRQVFNFRKGEFAYKGDVQIFRQHGRRLLAGFLTLAFMLSANVYTRYSVLNDTLAKMDARLCEITEQLLGQCQPSYTRALSMLEAPAATAGGGVVPRMTGYDLLYEIYANLPRSTPVPGANVPGQPNNVAGPDVPAEDPGAAEAIPAEVAAQIADAAGAGAADAGADATGGDDPGIELKEIDVNERRVRIEGTVKSFNAIDRIVTGLKRSECFNPDKGAVIDQGRSRRTPDGSKIEFDITITTNCG